MQHIRDFEAFMESLNMGEICVIGVIIAIAFIYCVNRSAGGRWRFWG